MLAIVGQATKSIAARQDEYGYLIGFLVLVIAGSEVHHRLSLTRKKDRGLFLGLSRSTLTNTKNTRLLKLP